MIMSMNTRAEILQMVADGVITQEEADRLIDALGASGQGQSDPPADGKLEAPENWQENGLCTETEEPCQNIRVEVDVGGLKLLPSWDGKLRSEVKMHSMGDRLTNYSYGVETRLGETYLYLKRKMFRPWGRNGGATLVVYVPSGMQRVNCKVTVGGCQVENITVEELHIHTDTGGTRLTGVQTKKTKITTSTGGIDYGRGNRAANQLELKAEVGAVSAFLSLDRGFHLFYNTNVGKLIDKLPSHIRIMKTGGQNIVGDSGEILYGDGACQINIESSTGAIQLKEDK